MKGGFGVRGEIISLGSRTFWGGVKIGNLNVISITRTNRDGEEDEGGMYRCHCVHFHFHCRKGEGEKFLTENPK